MDFELKITLERTFQLMGLSGKELRPQHIPPGTYVFRQGPNPLVGLRTDITRDRDRYRDWLLLVEDGVVSSRGLSLFLFAREWRKGRFKIAGDQADVARIEKAFRDELTKNGW